MITERDVRNEALKALAAEPGGFLTTSQLIERLEKTMKPNGHDANIINGRSDTFFSQKVRNLVSHRNSNTGLSAKKLADYDPVREGWTITNKGKHWANSL